MPEQAWEAPPAVVPAPPLAGPQEQQRVKKSVPGWAIGLIAALTVITLALGVGGVLLATGVIPFGSPDKTSSDSKASVENSATNEGESKDDSSNKGDSAASKDGSSGDGGSAASDEKKKAEKVPTAPPASFGSSPSGDPRSGKTSTPQNSYIVQDSQRRILSTRDIAGLSDDDLARAQNEIWARHGRMFNNQWLQNYFNSQSWYSGTIPADQFLSQYKPTSTEEKNAALMIDILNEHGYDVNRAHPN
ncbi:MAG: YARHG domain-containing protein [Clostridia bacterium]